MALCLSKCMENILFRDQSNRNDFYGAIKLKFDIREQPLVYNIPTYVAR